MNVINKLIHSELSLRGPPWRDRLKTGGGFINNPGLGQGAQRRSNLIRLLRFARNDHFLLTFTISAIMLFALNSSGCAPKIKVFNRAGKISRIMDSWLGHYQSELIAYWGLPTKIVPDGKGGNIIIYESLKGTWGNIKDKRIVGGAHYPTEGRQPGYAATRIFYVNEKGIVYSWKWSGL